jgi:hypothetical protein
VEIISSSSTALLLGLRFGNVAHLKCEIEMRFFL